MDGASVPPPWATEEERLRADWFRETQGDRVQILADGLGLKLEEVYMLERWGGGTALWAAWEVRRDISEEGATTICTKVRDRNIP